MNTQSTQNISTASTSSLRIVKAPGKLIDTQAVANAIGRNWQYVNKLRSAGGFIDPAAKLQTGAYLYRVSDARKWAKQNGHGFSLNG